MSADIQTDSLAQNAAQDTGAHYEAGGQDQILINEAVDVRDADFTRDGQDLTLNFDGGETITIDGYFDGLSAPVLSGADGAQLSPDLVQSFLKSGDSYDVAQNASMSDVSPVGFIQEVSGEVSITRVDGSMVQAATIGTEVYTGDIVETNGVGAANIVFSDETSFAVSENARLAIDEYVYDPATEEGAQNFSVLKGVFVFTSGLIGRDDPDDVEINTPSGSIGIRGTIIAGDVDAGEITVVEGAIVLRDFDGNEMTLATQYDTAKFAADNGGIEHMGVMEAAAVSHKFASVSNVAPTLFSSVDDSAHDASGEEAQPIGEDSAIQAEDALNDAPQDLQDTQNAPEDAQPDAPSDAPETLQGAEENLMDGAEDNVDAPDQGMDQVDAADGTAPDGVDVPQIDLAAKQGAVQNLQDMAFDANVDVGTRIKAFKTLQAINKSIASDEAAAQDDGGGTLSADDVTQAIDPNALPPQNTGPVVVDLPSGASDQVAFRGYAIYKGDAGDNNFTNVESGITSVLHRDIAFVGDDGNDTMNVTVDNSGMRFIGFNGGAGTDVLNIDSLGTASLDFSNVGALRGIEAINMASTGGVNVAGGDTTLTLTEGMVLSNINDPLTWGDIGSTLDTDIDIGGLDASLETFSTSRVMKIDGDGSDSLYLALNNNWETVDTGEVFSASGTGATGYTGYYNATENVTLLVSDNLSGAVTGAIAP